MTLPPLLRKRPVQVGIGIVVLLLGAALWPQAVPVDLAPVERGGLLVTVDEEGETRVRDRFLISAAVAGRLLRIELEPGDPVRRGETVARLVPAPPALLDARTRAEAAAAVEAARAALGRARAERERVQAVRDRARSEQARHRELLRAGIVAADVVEARETEARSAEEALRAAAFAAATAEHELERARAQLVQASGGGRTIEIHSPVQGEVLRRLRESEAVVPAGEPLLEVGDPRDLEIVSDLLSSDAVKVRPGQRVLVEQWGGERTLEGRVRRVEPAGFLKISALGVEEQRVNVIVGLEDPPEARPALGDAYRVEVRVVVFEEKETLKVPTSSLFRKEAKWAVFAADGGRARLRTVEVGRRNGLEAQILSGVAEGEAVVVHPSDRLEDGGRIAPRPSSS
jgi:HlyD family secretion protein